MSIGLESHAAHRDKFELDDPGSGFALAFPCCCCLHRHKTDGEEPCRTCDHNANAIVDDCKQE